MTTNGQAPFVTIFMYLRDDDPYIKENAMIIEEILRQRIQGIKNKDGVYVTPAFPKLIYVLSENNIHEDSEYYYLTKLAAECTAKRIYPDYISEKIMKENYDGEVFGCMGCRSFLSEWKDPETGEKKWEGRLTTSKVKPTLNDVNARKSGVIVFNTIANGRSYIRMDMQSPIIDLLAYHTKHLEYAS
jgi:ribonucleoside-triphosphate reductase